VLPPELDMIGALLGPRGDDPGWVRLASPLHHVEDAPATAPVLLVHGMRDTLVSYRESERLHRALTAAGRASELLLLEDAPHAFQIDWRGGANQRANAAMDVFLERHLG
jgi:dipeptidyl aminopeptidase/acylaminoacyl peptidase